MNFAEVGTGALPPSVGGVNLDAKALSNIAARGFCILRVGTMLNTSKILDYLLDKEVRVLLVDALRFELLSQRMNFSYLDAERAGSLFQEKVTSRVPGAQINGERKLARLLVDCDISIFSSGSMSGGLNLYGFPLSDIRRHSFGVWQSLHLNSSDYVVNVLPLSYVFGLSNYFLGYFFAQRALSYDPKAIFKLKSEMELTLGFSGEERCYVGMVPPMIRAIVRAGLFGRVFDERFTLGIAGGGLGYEEIKNLAGLSDSVGVKLHCMYGQTEVFGRALCSVAIKPSSESLGFSGHPIAGVEARLMGSELQLRSICKYQKKITIESDGRLEAVSGDRTEWLSTGDEAEFVPKHGYRILGRSGHFLKIGAIRFSQAEIDEQLTDIFKSGQIYSVVSDDILYVGIDTEASRSLSADAKVSSVIAAKIGVSPHVIRVKNFEQLPLLPSGKYDYAALMVSR